MIDSAVSFSPARSSAFIASPYRPAPVRAKHQVAVPLDYEPGAALPVGSRRPQGCAVASIKNQIAVLLHRQAARAGPGGAGLPYGLAPVRADDRQIAILQQVEPETLVGRTGRAKALAERQLFPG